MRELIGAVFLLLSLAPFVASSAFAGPQDEDTTPSPGTTVTAGNGFYTSDSPSYTLTLEAAGREGGLESGQLQAAIDAAAQADDSSSTGSEDSGSPAWGDRSSPGGDGGSVDSSATVPGAGGGGTGTAVDVECQWRVADVPTGDSRWGTNDPTAGSLVVSTCNGPATYLFVPDSALVPAAGEAAPPPPPPPDPAVLAQQARTELTLPLPTAHRSPPETNSDPAYGGLPYTWVGLSTFFWVDEWQPMTRTVQLRGVSATVTATPTAVTVDPGDGNAAVTCDGPGRPWMEADGNKPPSNGACGYTYRSVTPNGPLTATTSVQWSVSWTSNTGATGTFPTSTTSSSSSFLVEQIQVVIR